MKANPSPEESTDHHKYDRPLGFQPKNLHPAQIFNWIAVPVIALLVVLVGLIFEHGCLNCLKGRNQVKPIENEEEREEESQKGTEKEPETEPEEEPEERHRILQFWTQLLTRINGIVNELV